MQSVVLDYHTINHLTHTAVTRLASFRNARVRYLLLIVFSFKSLSVLNPSYHQRFLIVRWTSKLITYGYEQSVTDASKPNKQIYQKCSVTTSLKHTVQNLANLILKLGSFVSSESNICFCVWYRCLVFRWYYQPPWNSPWEVDSS
jgi:hypothetical protein